MLTLYQAEWCPFSSAVREVLTELGVDFVTRQVEPWPEERRELQALAGTDQIPVLQAEDGRLYRGTREIFAHLRELEPWQFAAEHRRRFTDHRDARESDTQGQLVEYFRASETFEDVVGHPAEAAVVDVPEASRSELRASAKGPLLVSGGVRVVAADGTVLYEGEKAALCRCGGSANKPFCDGTHKTIDFEG